MNRETEREGERERERERERWEREGGREDAPRPVDVQHDFEARKVLGP